MRAEPVADAALRVPRAVPPSVAPPPEPSVPEESSGGKANAAAARTAAVPSPARTSRSRERAGGGTGGDGRARVLRRGFCGRALLPARRAPGVLLRRGHRIARVRGLLGAVQQPDEGGQPVLAGEGELAPLHQEPFVGQAPAAQIA